MRLPDAIEKLKLAKKDYHPVVYKDYIDAFQLGIEALKVVLEIRHYPFPDGIVCLPGETKE